ncbi:MAG: M20/M25/M40 family metallo-hydrolase [Mogibacterium sp.]|nr:M20/M25/M40 family metallo-hydrolase [Mogibacterium sp.]
MKEQFRTIHRLVEDNRDEMIRFWEKLVNIDSGSRNLAGLEKMCQAVRERMEEIGFITQVILCGNAGPILVGDLNREIGTTPILFIGHMDTVFSEGEAEKNPFRIDSEGHAHGPGVLDMKAGLVIALYAAKILKAMGYNDHPIRCIFAGDEENLHMFSDAKARMSDAAEGGCAAFNFETGYPDDGLVVGRNGGGIFELTVDGVSVHSGIAPWEGRSAIAEMCNKVLELEKCNDYSRGKMVNCGVIQGGTTSNTVPGHCKLDISIRFPSSDIKNEIVEDLKRIAGMTFIEGTATTLSEKALMESMDTTDGVRELYAHIEKTAADCGYGKVHSFRVGGVSDSGIMVMRGIPTVCALGVKGEFNHTPREYAIVDSLFERTALAASIVHEFDNQEVK